MELMSGGVQPAPAPTSYRHLLGVPSTDDFIVAIDKVTLVQNAASVGSSKQDPRWGCHSLSLFALALASLVNTIWLEIDCLSLCSAVHSMTTQELACRPLAVVVQPLHDLT